MVRSDDRSPTFGLMAALGVAFGIFHMDMNLKHSLWLCRISPTAPIAELNIASTGSDSLENPTMFAAMPWGTELLFEGV